jgi:hypothetical protein
MTHTRGVSDLDPSTICYHDATKSPAGLEMPPSSKSACPPDKSLGHK